MQMPAFISRKIWVAYLGSSPDEKTISNIHNFVSRSTESSLDAKVLVHHVFAKYLLMSPHLDFTFNWLPYPKSSTTEEWKLLREFANCTRLIEPHIESMFLRVQPASEALIFMNLTFCEIGALVAFLHSRPAGSLPIVIFHFADISSNPTRELQRLLIRFSLDKISHLIGLKVFLWHCRLDTHGQPGELLSWFGFDGFDFGGELETLLNLGYLPTQM